MYIKYVEKYMHMHMMRKGGAAVTPSVYTAISNFQLAFDFRHVVQAVADNRCTQL